MIATFVLLALLQLKVPDAAQAVGAPQGTPVAGAALDQRTREVSSMLRCPVCQGLSVADSPSQMAVNMNAQVRELLARGYTEEQILAYFEKSYGQFVLLKPKFRGVTSLVWVLPVLVLAIGFVIVVTKAKQLEAEPQRAAVPADEADDPYLARVRELVEK